MSEENNNTSNELTPDQTSQMMINLSAEWVTIVEKVETAKSDQKRDIIKDLTTAGLALLGGVLTLATVGSDYIRTPQAVYIGAAIVALSVMVGFYVRIKIGRRFTRIIDRQYNDYSSRANAARGLLTNPMHGQSDFIRTINEVPFSQESFSKRLESSEIVISILLLAGATLTIIGLIFNISIS